MLERIDLNKHIYIEKPEDVELIPERAFKGDAGLDLKISEDMTIPAGKTAKGYSGIKVQIPEGYFGMIVPRSSIGIKKGLMLANSVGVIDSQYRGEIILALHNYSDEEVKLDKHERVAQLIIIPIITPVPLLVSELDDSERGTGGIGSSGKK